MWVEKVLIYNKIYSIQSFWTHVDIENKLQHLIKKLYKNFYILYFFLTPQSGGEKRNLSDAIN